MRLLILAALAASTICFAQSNDEPVTETPVDEAKPALDCSEVEKSMDEGFQNLTHLEQPVDGFDYFKQTHTEVERVQRRHDIAKADIFLLKIMAGEKLEACREANARIDSIWIFGQYIYADTKMYLAFRHKSKAEAKSAQMDFIEIQTQIRLAMGRHSDDREMFEHLEIMANIDSDLAVDFIVTGNAPQYPKPKDKKSPQHRR